MQFPAWLLITMLGAVLLACTGGCWVLTTRALRRRSGLVRSLDFDPGVVLRESGWGSAVINGVGAHNVVKLAECENGWLLRMMPLGGGGKLWLPKEGIQIGEIEPGGWWQPAWRRVKSGTNELWLAGSLADFIVSGDSPPPP